MFHKNVIQELKYVYQTEYNKLNHAIVVNKILNITKINCDVVEETAILELFLNMILKR